MTVLLVFVEVHRGVVGVSRKPRGRGYALTTLRERIKGECHIPLFLRLYQAAYVLGRAAGMRLGSGKGGMKGNGTNIPLCYRIPNRDCIKATLLFGEGTPNRRRGNAVSPPPHIANKRQGVHENRTPCFVGRARRESGPFPSPNCWKLNRGRAGV